MVEVTTVYEGSLRCRATHGPSGQSIITDAPVDNHGKGEAFSPTDLVAAALGSCMLTIMGIAASRHGIALEGATAVTNKEMATSGTRRIVSLRTVLTIPLPPDHPNRELLENSARSCPVHKSLAAEVDAPIEFRFLG
ncbi:MAG: OsmC family protein [Planctomycetota bacterium]|nr:OsmC family protein [Planctomycetota bacterium]MDA1106219.1 OsmC family protein [Planctomycetota bacterium]